MAIPLVIWGVFELAALAMTVYEIAEMSKEMYEGVQKYKGDLEQAKKEVREVIESIEKEIAEKIKTMEEVAILLALEKTDPQGEHTRKASGRGATEPTISAAIEQKIPFRDAISKVCATANRIPILSLRKKKGRSIKDLPKAKREAFLELLAFGVEKVADVNLEKFTVVRLKQLTANFLFEFIDESLSWASPLKCEVSFGPGRKFADHPVEGATKLQRVGTINPFYPTPFRFQSGSISADLMIPEYRHQRPDKGNIFAIVEIKFPGDSIEKEQFVKYNELIKAAILVKQGRAPVTFEGKRVNSGGRLALFRYPEDIAVHKKEEPNKPGENKEPGSQGKQEETQQNRRTPGGRSKNGNK